MRHNQPSPTVYHEEDPSLRVVNRGKLWHFQEYHLQRDDKGTPLPGRENDPWHDMAPPQDTREAAVTIMYTCKPLKPKQIA